jgi:ATP-binding cassette subfamily F protein 3
LEYVNLQISGTNKVLVQGANGQGKSTLAKLILGQLAPTAGAVSRHVQTIAHFHQDALLGLIYQYGNITPVDFLLTRNENLLFTDARTHLGRFGLRGNIALRQIRKLLAGQRVRLWLARGFFLDSTKKNKPSLLILDEVTENLDKERDHRFSIRVAGTLLSSRFGYFS